MRKYDDGRGREKDSHFGRYKKKNSRILVIPVGKPM